jgi:acyl carrier protein
MDTIEQLKRLIHQEYDIEPSTIDADQPFASYNVDSLTLAELLFAIEDNFHVVVPDEALATVTNLRELASMLDALLAAKAA